MTKEEIFKLMNASPAFYLATVEEDQPRVRGMLLYRADEEGIIFHTASTKDVYKQLMENPKAEMCFFKDGVQVRVTGCFKLIKDDKLKEEIFNHPSRKFLQNWKDLNIDHLLSIFKMEKGKAIIWTFDKNFAPKKEIDL